MPQFFISNKIWLALAVIVAAVILFFSVVWGLGAGKQLAQAELIANNANSLKQGLKFFYQDQDRFPTAVEFTDQNTMLNYFSSFPPTEFPSPSCNGSYVYKRASLDSFQLNFCLPKAFNYFSSGWNVVTNDKN